MRIIFRGGDDAQFAEVAEREALAQQVVPDEAAPCVGQRVEAEVVGRADVVAIFFAIGRGEPLHRPLVADARAHTTAIVVVQQHEIIGQRMDVRSGAAREFTKLRLHIAPPDVAEHLVEFLVFLDDENDVFEG